MSLEPGVSFYNVGNLSNYTNGGISGVLHNVIGGGSPSGEVNGPNSQDVLNQYRTGRGSGTFDANGPRSTEFQLKLTF